MVPFSKQDLLGHLNQEEDPRFCFITNFANEDLYFLRREAADAWNLMVEAALPDGVEIFPVSATRNFERQKTIWENKWSGRSPVNKMDPDVFAKFDSLHKAREIMKYSAMPGTSRHHWGTDIDINSVEPEYFESAEGRKVFLWLQVNAERFGFAMPYTARQDGRLLGYEEEKWHWSYLPLARPMLQQYIMLIDYQDIVGFEGCETAEALQVIPHFVMGIAPSCR